MKAKILILMIIGLLISCSKDDNGQRTEKMRINYYRNTGFGFGPSLSLVTQQGSNIGTQKWSNFYDEIKGFEYEPGYIYEILVQTEPIKNPPVDGSSLKYTLKKIISKNKVDNKTPFKIDLKINGVNFVKDKKILRKIEIDCNDLCDELERKLESQKSVIGEFNRLEKDKIKLIVIE